MQEAGSVPTRSVPVNGATLDEVLAPWPVRIVSEGIRKTAGLMRDTAFLMAFAPAFFLYLPPRLFDIFFWSTNQRPWLDVLFLDEMIYEYCLQKGLSQLVLLITGDKAADDCVLGPAGGEDRVRQDHAHLLLDKHDLLGVGFKSSRTAGGSFEFHFNANTIDHELAQIGRGELIFVFVVQDQNSLEPPQYCVATQRDHADLVAAFNGATVSGKVKRISKFKLQQQTGRFVFHDAETAAEKIVNEYEAYKCRGLPQKKYQDFLVGVDAGRNLNQRGRAFEEENWARAGYGVRAYCGAGKAQFEVTLLELADALELHRFVRGREELDPLFVGRPLGDSGADAPRRRRGDDAVATRWRRGGDARRRVLGRSAPPRIDGGDAATTRR